MFESLTEKLENAINKIKGSATITDDNIKEALRDVRLALLEADVNYKVVKEFTNKVKEKALGSEVKKSLKPGDVFLKILKDELLELLGNEKADVDLSKSPSIVMLVGLQGSGKTTTIGKLASKFQKSEKHPQISFIAGDTFRAAAVEQLSIWGERNRIRVFKGTDGCDSAGLCYDGIQEAIKCNDDIVFIDTAGRLQNKNGLMDELKKIIRVIKKIIPEAPHQILLTLDATTGQNALEQTKIFKEMCQVDGLIITKLDGSAKGGILVAIAEENPLPVYYIGVGEGIEDLDTFSAHDYARNLLDI